jgi:hypothetical protein
MPEAATAMPASVKRLVRRRVRGWKMPPNTVSVTRPGKWGNPFKVTGERPPERAVADFRLELRYETLAIELEMPVRSQHMRWIAKHINELRGKNLACYCKAGQPCHADVLLSIANPNAELRHSRPQT